MYSFSLDYLFNRVYDVLLWIKYVWLFVLFRVDPQQYLLDHESRVWDGLRDRGWLDYAKEGAAPIISPDAGMTLWERLLHKLGWKLPDSDGDGIPDASDPSPHDAANLTASQLKERYQADYTTWDSIRDFLGFGPKDSDGDGVPNSYEEKHHMNPNNPDTDHDGLLDGQELALGTDPLNNDSDGDGVIDGRDEAPLDPSTAALGIDSDGDGVSDVIEQKLGMDINNRDSDSDGIPDGMDTYPLDPTNIGDTHQVDYSTAAAGLHFSIQNPILAFIADLYSAIAIIALIILAYVFLRWLWAFWSAQMMYEEHFAHGAHHADKHSSHGGTSIGIPGLATKEDSTSVIGENIHAPTQKDFETHPRWAIIEGYMTSNQEALWRIGILEADNMLADALREKGYLGEDVGEMLKNANFRSVQLAWEAHKMRNRIAHDGSSFVLTEREMKKTISLYEAVFREMKLI